MGRQRAVKDAEQQAEEETWQCKTCDAPAEPDGRYCMCCRMYWEDSREMALSEDYAAPYGVLGDDGERHRVYGRPIVEGVAQCVDEERR